MYKKAIAAVLLFGISFANAQTDSIYAEIQVVSFSLGKDTVNLKTPKQIILRKIGCSEIVTIGNIDGMDIGMQLELVRSYLGKESLVITGKAIFRKLHDEWLMSKYVIYQKAEFIMVPDISSMKQASGGGVFQFNISESIPFSVSYKERYYFFW